MGNVHRPTGRLSPRPHSHFSQKMARFLYRPDVLPIQLPTRRPGNCTQDFHTSGGSGNRVPVLSRSLDLHLPGRLAVSSPIQGEARSHCTSHLPASTPSGLICNIEKSQLKPTRQIEFLGARLDFSLGKAFPSQSQIDDTTQCAKDLLKPL